MHFTVSTTNRKVDMTKLITKWLPALNFAKRHGMRNPVNYIYAYAERVGNRLSRVNAKVIGHEWLKVQV